MLIKRMEEDPTLKFNTVDYNNIIKALGSRFDYAA